ncbi:hypothetical protein PoMZ_08122 [Pyricularia oryzae]|uniref:Rhodopsin domain-containing protein n=1 Tax=Pyricularia oryzae TaxID=318829 RepID=A0A4P7NH31_PYROR|nr:hypothetical protein PoMZ_08122 [Pyricularia oryzae]
MSDFDQDLTDKIRVQGWTMYAVGIVFIGLRMYASITKLGWRHLRLDDLLMLPVLVLYTGLIVGLNVLTLGGGSVPYPPDAAGPLTEGQIRARIQGSKVAVVNEQCLLNLLYILKCCMLVLYTRLTLGTNTQRLVRLVAVYVALCWATTQVVFFTHCRPFSGMYAFPPPSQDCATYERYELAEGILNITSDLLILCIPISLVVRVNMPWRQKAVLLVVFSTGIFVILAAVLTKYYDLVTDWGPAYMIWYVRETSVAVYVANMPIIWPLVLQWLPSLRPKSKMTRESSEPVLPAPAFAMPVFAGVGGSAGPGGADDGGGAGGDGNGSFVGSAQGRNAAESRHSDDGSEIDIRTALGTSPDFMTPPQRACEAPPRSLGSISATRLDSDGRGEGQGGNGTGTAASMSLPAEASGQGTGTNNDKNKKASGGAT